MRNAITIICWLGLALIMKAIFTVSLLDATIGCIAFFGGLAFYDEV